MTIKAREGVGVGDFLANVVASLPGVDVNDPRVKEELEKAKKKGEKK